MSQQIETPTAQQSPMEVKPQPQHRWLQRLVGEWTYEFEPMSPDQPGAKAAGVERVRKVGDLWVVAESEGQMPGSGPITMMVTLGYDPAKKKFVGSWIGSMMTEFWVYEGDLDAAERVLTLSSTGPSMKGDGSTAQYQDVIELASDDRRIFTARILDDDGTWKQMMRAEYRRTK